MKNLFSKPFQLLLALGVCFVIAFSMLMFGDGWSIDMVIPSAFLFFGVYCLYKIIDPDKDLNNNTKNVVESNKTGIYRDLAGERITTYVAGVTFENRQELVRQIKIGDNVKLIPEPNNAYDKNAINVVSNVTNLSLGYIPRDLSSKVWLYTLGESPIIGHVINITNKGTDHIGLEISFELPSSRKPYNIYNPSPPM